MDESKVIGNAIRTLRKEKELCRPEIRRKPVLLLQTGARRSQPLHTKTLRDTQSPWRFARPVHRAGRSAVGVSSVFRGKPGRFVKHINILHKLFRFFVFHAILK